jgi:dTDP-4-amino-4,6-dideoxygalactose transaminase
LVCSSQATYERAKLLSGHNKEKDIKAWEYKFIMNDINATIGIENLIELEDALKIYRSNAEFYKTNLKGLGGITLPIMEKPNRYSSYWAFTLLADDAYGLKTKLKENGIVSGVIHERNDKHTCVKHFREQLPGTDVISKEMLCIPVGWWVTNENRLKIVETIMSGW